MFHQHPRMYEHGCSFSKRVKSCELSSLHVLQIFFALLLCMGSMQLMCTRICYFSSFANTGSPCNVIVPLQIWISSRIYKDIPQTNLWAPILATSASFATLASHSQLSLRCQDNFLQVLSLSPDVRMNWDYNGFHFQIFVKVNSIEIVLWARYHNLDLELLTFTAED